MFVFGKQWDGHSRIQKTLAKYYSAFPFNDTFKSYFDTVQAVLVEGITPAFDKC